MTEHPFCKPLLHRMAISSLNPHQAPHDHTPTANHLHASPAPWHPCPVHGHPSAPSSCDNRSSDSEPDCSAGEVKSSLGERGSWQQENNKELKKACEKLCDQIQWKSEKHYQEVARSSFQEIMQCQAALRALHIDSGGKNGYNRRSCDRETLSLGQSQSSFSDATFARPFRECCTERPVSAPMHRIISSPGRRNSQIVPDDLLQRYSSVSKGRKGVNSLNPSEDNLRVVPLHASPRIDRSRSKSADPKKPRFCTGLNRGNGEDGEPVKKMLNVVPMIMLHRDKTKGVWNRKANQKESWDHGRRGCCSQHCVSVLENNDKVFHADGRKALSARESLSPIPKGKFAAMATQKLKVLGERCRPQVARSLDLSSSPLSSLKAIVHDMNRPQSASLPKRSNGVSTPRSASSCKSRQKPSIAVTPARKLNNPELHSSAWLLAKMESLRNETFTEPKALQIAKEHGIVLDKEDESALKKFLQSEQSPRLDAAERERNKTHEKYFNLSNIRLAESAAAARKLKKQLSPKAHAARIRECCKNSTSDLLVASDQCSQVFPE